MVKAAESKAASKHRTSKKEDGGKLTPRQSRFVDEYLIDLNGTQAAIRSGYAKGSADVASARLLANDRVMSVIRDRQKARQERTEITADMVLKRWWEIANADPNELIQFRRENCRYCHGEDHEYQWIDEAEYQRACDEAGDDDDEDKKLPSAAGGFGFRENRDPHPDCPICGGEGRGRVFAQDTRRLSGPARLLYDGVKQTKEGLEIKLLDRGKALENVARHLGMFNDKLTLKGDAENPLTLLLKQVSGSSLPVVKDEDAE